MPDTKIALNEVQAAIQKANAGWEAGLTSVSELSMEQLSLRCGMVPPPGEVSIHELEGQMEARRAAVHAEIEAVRGISASAAFDLRNVDGRNFVTLIKDQGNCGSCVAFGTTVVVESTFRMQRNDAGLAIDLSEANLFYCHAKSEGRNCGNGWWPDRALEFYKNVGVVDEACFPYTAGDQACKVCSDWQSRVTKISGYHKISAVADMKTWISTRGPITGCFVVYQDFMSYRSGVYRHVTGTQVGGHCVAIIGYNDAGGYWICKNSWGTGWGESGFFRIAYGECGIDTWAGPYGVDGIVESGWLNGRKVLGLWSIDQDRNAWVFLDGNIGWRRIAADNDNIFINLLTLLATAKQGKRPVNIYQMNAIVTQVYVL